MSHDGPPTDDLATPLEFDPNALAAVQAENLANASGAYAPAESEMIAFEQGEPVTAEEPILVESGTEAGIVEPTAAELYQGMNTGALVPGSQELGRPAAVDFELPLGEEIPSIIEVLKDGAPQPAEQQTEQPPEALVQIAETVRSEERSGFEEFKANVSNRFGGMLSRAGNLWSKIKGAGADVAWKGAYGAYKAPQVVAGGAVAGYNAVADAGTRAGERVIAGVENVAEAGREFITDAKEVTQEIGGAIKEAGMEMGRDAKAAGKAVLEGAGTAAMVGIGAGVFAVEAAGRGISATVELGQKGIEAGQKFVESGIETVNRKKQEAVQKMDAMRASAVAAVTSVANAAEAKTKEYADASKEMIANGVKHVAEAGVAIKERAESGFRSAKERLLMKKNEIKNRFIAARLGYHKAGQERLEAELAKKKTKVDNIRGAFVRIPG